MRIGIDARMFGSHQGGLGRYVEQLIKALEQLDTVNEYLVFLNRQNWAEYRPVNSRWQKILADVPWYGWREQLLWPLFLRKFKLDLMHFPHWNVPILFRRSFVVTIHDLILLYHPSRRASTLGPVRYWIKNVFFRIVLRNAVRRSRRIIVPSEWVRQDLQKHFSINQQKISVIYEGAGVTKMTAENKVDLSPYGINRPYLLYVGVAYPHKNLDNLVRAFKIFRVESGLDYQLVLVGRRDYFYNRLREQIKQYGDLPVVFTDYVADSDLATFYQRSALYVFPSLYEGFGLPALEAMANVAPVAASDNTCLPEILGEAAAYFDPHSPEKMAKVFNRVLTDSHWRQELIIKGLKQAQKYSWLDCGQKTLLVFKSVI